jgi:hypothetical protein
MVPIRPSLPCIYPARHTLPAHCEPRPERACVRDTRDGGRDNSVPARIRGCRIRRRRVPLRRGLPDYVERVNSPRDPAEEPQELIGCQLRSGAK